MAIGAARDLAVVAGDAAVLRGERLHLLRQEVLRDAVAEPALLRRCGPRRRKCELEYSTHFLKLTKPI